MSKTRALKSKIINPPPPSIASDEDFQAGTSTTASPTVKQIKDTSVTLSDNQIITGVKEFETSKDANVPIRIRYNNSDIVRIGFYQNNNSSWTQSLYNFANESMSGLGFGCRFIDGKDGYCVYDLYVNGRSDLTLRQNVLKCEDQPESSTLLSSFYTADSTKNIYSTIETWSEKDRNKYVFTIKNKSNNWVEGLSLHAIGYPDGTNTYSVLCGPTPKPDSADKEIPNIGYFKQPTARIKTVIETYSNGTEWYRVWNDGWKEQGGTLLITSAGVGISHKVNLLVPFSDTAYTALSDIVRAGGDTTVSTHVANFTNSSFDIVTNYAYVASGGDKTTWCAYGF